MRRNIIAALALLLWGAGLTAAVAQQAVKLGVLNDQTGLYADLTGMGSVHAARMAVEDYGGKVLGRPIEVIFADHQNKPDIGANIARQWIETEGVHLILDIPNSAVGLAVREVTRTHDAVDINTGAATSDLSGKACSPHGVHWSFDTHALALEAAQGLTASETFFWDLDDTTRAWTKRFLARNGGKPPSMIHAGTYGATLHYLKAVAAAGTTDATKVVAKMKELPIDDFYTKGTVREDGRVMRPYYLLQVKKPSESRYPFDYLKLLATVSAEQAARPLSESM